MLLRPFAICLLAGALSPLAACSEPDEPAGPGLLRGSFVRMGRPSDAHHVVPHLEVFRDRLYLTTSASPLQEPGTALWSTADGTSFALHLEEPGGEGFVRMRAVDGALYAPEADPPGIGPGRVWVSRDGEGFTPEPIPDAVHTYDVARFDGALLSSNGTSDGKGALYRRSAEGAWSEAATAPARRLQFMAVFRRKLFVSKDLADGPTDYFLWKDGLAGGPSAVDALPGEQHTFRWYASSRGRLFWSHWSKSGGHQVHVSDDGASWSPVPELADQFASGFAELDGALYAITANGLWGSRDHRRFELLVPSEGRFPFGPSVRDGHMNVEAMASLVSWRGALWCGSSRDGSLYRVGK